MPPAPSGPPPVHLAAPTVRARFAPGRDTALARVAGDGLRALDIRDGDHVVLCRRERAEHGDVAAVLEGTGRACLWKVYPEGERLRLSMGRPSLQRWSGEDWKIQGVVVAVLRQLDEGPRASSRTCDVGPETARQARADRSQKRPQSGSQDARRSHPKR